MMTCAKFSRLLPETASEHTDSPIISLRSWLIVGGGRLGETRLNAEQGRSDQLLHQQLRPSFPSGELYDLSAEDTPLRKI